MRPDLILWAILVWALIPFLAGRGTSTRLTGDPDVPWPECVECGADIENESLRRTGSLTCEDCRLVGGSARFVPAEDSPECGA